MAEPAGGARGAARLGLRYGRLTLAVESDDAGHIEWLREFLAPAFEVVEPSIGGRVIRVRTDATAYAAAVARGPGSESVSCFWLDTRVIRLPEWTPSEPGERLAFDGEARAFYRLNGGASIDILASGEGRTVRDALMRVTRELAMTDLRQAGGLVLHAAALAARERVVLLAGPKGAGKTTLLVHLLRAPGARFVANDRVAIPAGAPAPEVRGLPTIVKLLRSSAAWFPGLGARLDASPYHHHLTLAEADRRPPPASPGPPREAFSLSPAQLCALLGTAPEPGGRLGAIVFPRQRPEAGPFTLRRLAPTDAAAAIHGAQLGSLRDAPGREAPGATPWAPEGAVSTEALTRARARCRELATAVPVYECELGRRAYDDPADAAGLLAALEV